jgi:hypothetical protein
VRTSRQSARTISLVVATATGMLDLQGNPFLMCPFYAQWFGQEEEDGAVEQAQVLGQSQTDVRMYSFLRHQGGMGRRNGCHSDEGVPPWGPRAGDT